MRTPLATLCAVIVAGTALATVPAKGVFVPSAGHDLGAVVTGVQAHWRADVWLYSPANGPTTAQIFLLLRNQANPNPVPPTFDLAAFETRSLPDIVFNTFGLDNTYGALNIVSPSTIVVTGGSGRGLADASSVDNRTGDFSTPDAANFHTFSFWDGVAADPATGTKIEGGIESDVGVNAVTTHSGVGGMPCGTNGTIYLPFRRGA